jgi:hypothetical protein
VLLGDLRVPSVSLHRPGQIQFTPGIFHIPRCRQRSHQWPS